jgi:hypothetical protein
MASKWPMKFAFDAFECCFVFQRARAMDSLVVFVFEFMGNSFL